MQSNTRRSLIGAGAAVIAVALVILRNADGPQSVTTWIQGAFSAGELRAGILRGEF